MAVHDTDATPAPATREVGLRPPLVTSSMLTGPRDAILNAQAENERQRLLVHNPDAEANSVTEHLELALRGEITPAAALARTTPLLREMLESNQRERGHQHAAAGPLDRLSTLLYAEGLRSALPIKDAARQLRPALHVIRDELSKGPGEPRDGAAYFRASCRVRDVIGQLTAETLRGSSLRCQIQRDNNSGTGLHDVLLYLLGDHDELPELLAGRAGESTRG